MDIGRIKNTFILNYWRDWNLLCDPLNNSTGTSKQATATQLMPEISMTSLAKMTWSCYPNTKDLSYVTGEIQLIIQVIGQFDMTVPSNNRRHDHQLQTTPFSDTPITNIVVGCIPSYPMLSTLNHQLYQLYHMYVCMYVCTYVCIYVSMYVCKYVCMYVCKFVCMYVCTYVCMYVCTYVCM